MLFDSGLKMASISVTSTTDCRHAYAVKLRLGLALVAIALRSINRATGVAFFGRLVAPTARESAAREELPIVASTFDLTHRFSMPNDFESTTNPENTLHLLPRNEAGKENHDRLTAVTERLERLGETFQGVDAHAPNHRVGCWVERREWGLRRIHLSLGTELASCRRPNESTTERWTHGLCPF